MPVLKNVRTCAGKTKKNTPCKNKFVFSLTRETTCQLHTTPPLEPVDFKPLCAKHNDLKKKMVQELVDSPQITHAAEDGESGEDDGESREDDGESREDDGESREDDGESREDDGESREALTTEFYEAVMSVLDTLYAAPEELLGFTSNDLVENVSLTEICFAGMLESQGFQLYPGERAPDGFYYTYELDQQCFCLFEVYEQFFFLPVYVNLQYSPTEKIKLAGSTWKTSMETIFVLLYQNKAVITFGDALVTKREQRSLDRYRATWQPAPVKTKGKFTFAMEEAITIDCSRFTDAMRDDCIDNVAVDLSMFIV
jgi:hypothetical protein